MREGGVSECNKSPSDRKEAITEAINLISNLNNPPRQSKAAETMLLRLQRRWPDIFTDVCLYSDVCLLMSQFQFRASSRRIIQEIFSEINYIEVKAYKILFTTDEMVNFFLHFS